MVFDPHSEITLSQAMSYLVHPKFGRNFYAMTLAPLVRIENPKIFAMGVGAIERRFALSYNPDWINDNPFEYVVGVIEHEALHLVLQHLPRGLRFRASLSGEELEMFSVAIDQYAADMAVNSLLVQSNKWMETHKSDEMIMPQHYDLPAGKSYEWYAKKLMTLVRDKPELYPELCKALENRYGVWVGSHAEWDALCQQMSDEEKEALANELDRHTKEIIKKVSSDYQKMCGDIPGHLKSQITAVLTPPTIPWTRLLRRVVVNTKQYRWRRSVARPSRRHIGVRSLFKFPGRVKDRVFHVVFAVDTSGSMSLPELALAFNELQHLQKADPDIKITIIEADVPVQRVYEVGPNDPINPEFTGRGGTRFDAALLESKKHEPDIMLYYTDGGASAPQVGSRVPCPFFWLLTPTGSNPDPDWGQVLRMEDRICA